MPNRRDSFWLQPAAHASGHSANPAPTPHNETTSTIYELTAQKCALLTNNAKSVFGNPYSMDTFNEVLPSPLECSIHLKLHFYDSSMTINTFSARPMFGRNQNETPKTDH
ncbi:hypothetical protein CEXT_126911 [Caerostris extrusa]|uniref:Uncharacterized protein n=1 Tax=Caerostris extrusa TaxID=172846 RepID=A0AAV4VRT4_CAEEX|nr:hypothetical protein CEXT_126911 [Caerostris extrusa]